MVGSVLYFWLVIVFVHQSKQIISKSELNLQVPRYSFGIKNNHYKNNIMDDIIQVQFWIGYCIMYVKYVIIIINNGDSIGAHVVDCKSIDSIIIIFLSTVNLFIVHIMDICTC